MKKTMWGVGVATLAAAFALTVSACAKLPRMEFSVRTLRQTPRTGGAENIPKPTPTPAPETVVPRLDPEWSPEDRGTSETRFERLAPLEA